MLRCPALFFDRRRCIIEITHSVASIFEIAFGLPPKNFKNSIGIASIKKFSGMNAAVCMYGTESQNITHCYRVLKFRYKAG